MNKHISHILTKRNFFLLLSFLVFTQTSCLRLSEVKKTFDNIKVAPAPPTTAKSFAEEFDLKSASGEVEKEAHQLIMAQDFNAIEKASNQARSKKQRLAGGYWKIDSIYEGVSNIYADYPKQEVTEEMWKNHIAILRKWKEQFPKSVTARIALAKAYVGYGWFARGNGYINTVSKENYIVFHERLDMAQTELLEAFDLDVKCPRWYREMLFLGMVNGWSPDEFNQLFEDAIKFEPNYLQYYLVKSSSLAPKWNGNPKDWQNYIDELPGKLATIKTDEADIIYFVVIANKMSDTASPINYANLSADRINKGFADLEKKFGEDNLRLNQFASLACFIQDFAAARKAFERIGDDWNRDVWGQQTFNIMKQLAFRDEQVIQQQQIVSH